MPIKKRSAATAGSLHVLFENKLADSGLNNSVAITKLKLKLTPAQFTPAGLPYQAGGIVIPYFDVTGKQTSFWRYRYLEQPKVTGFDAITEHKWLRYVQAPKTLNELYLCPLVPWAKIAKGTDIPIMFTEGEFKAASACAHTKVPTIGLGGVWMFRSATTHNPILPAFKQFDWKSRKVYICYDSDAATNPKVLQAQNAFANTLVSMGADVFICKLQPGDGKKVGLDDYLIAGNGSMDTLLSSASEWKRSRELHTLNEEVVYVRDPGIVLRLDNLQRMAPQAFQQHAYSTRIFYEEVQTAKGVKLEERSAAKEWIKWPARAEVLRTTYAPGQERVHNGQLNLWPGWGCTPQKGDVTLWKELLNYVFRGDKAAITWFERWCAYPIQYPGTKLYTSCLVWGRKQGTGKSFIGYSLFKIYGRNATEIKERDLQSTHNEWAENKQFVMGEEISSGDKRNTSDYMKSLITQEQLRINIKYIPSFVVPDVINYYFTSNHPDSFFLEDEDRRNFIWELVGDPMPREWYKRYEAWIGKRNVVGPGAAALFHHLMTLDLGDFDPAGQAPMTFSKLDMISMGRSDVGTWVARLKESPDSVLKMGEHISGWTLWRVEDLHRLYDPDGKSRVSVNGLARELRRHGFEKVANGAGVFTKTDGQVRLWAVRPPPQGYRIHINSEAAALYDKERSLAPMESKLSKPKYSK